MLSSDYNMLGESFETSVEWKNVLPLCTKVKERIALSCKERNLPEEPFISCRITQVSGGSVTVLHLLFDGVRFTCIALRDRRLRLLLLRHTGTRR